MRNRMFWVGILSLALTGAAPASTPSSAEILSLADGPPCTLIRGVQLLRAAQGALLRPGDLIATGTPAGVGPVVAGDVMEVSIHGVGTLRNTVVDE